MAQFPTAQYADREGWYVEVDLYMDGARNCHSMQVQMKALNKNLFLKGQTWHPAGLTTLGLIWRSSQHQGYCDVTDEIQSARKGKMAGNQRTGIPNRASKHSFSEQSVSILARVQDKTLF